MFQSKPKDVLKFSYWFSWRWLLDIKYWNTP